MPIKEKLLKKLFRSPVPKNFTVKELDALMGKCGCEKFQGGRGSGIRYRHMETGRKLTFDTPHPGKELTRYMVEKTQTFLLETGEYRKRGEQDGDDGI